MKPILYVETNFAVAVAKGQDPEAARLLGEGDGDDPAIHVPAVCFMEALSVLVSEKKRWKAFHDGLKRQAREMDRDLTSPTAGAIARKLEGAGLEGDDLLDQVEARLYETLSRLSGDAEILPATPDVIADGLASPHLDDPTDNLILVTVLDHARRHPDSPKAFLSANHHDFEQPAVVRLLEEAGVKYFARTQAALGWLRSQADGPPVPGS